MLELINCKLIFTKIWSQSNRSGKFTPNADRASLDTQIIWSEVDFSGAHIMPSKKDKNIKSENFVKIYSEFQILYLMIYLLKDSETINCLHLNSLEEHLLPLQTLHSFAKINRNFNLKPLTTLAKRSIFRCLTGPEMFLCMWIKHSS